MEEKQGEVQQSDPGIESGPIVVGIDSSSVSRHALEEAVRMAAWTGEDVYAVNYIYDEEMETFNRWLPGQQNALIAGRQMKLEKWLEELDFVTEKVKIQVSAGHPFSELSNLVKTIKPAMLVVGMHGTESGEGSHSASYFARACLGDGTTDVMFVRNHRADSFNKIVVGIDFSPNSRRALQKAASLAVIENCPLHVIHIFAPNWEHFGNPGDLSEDVDEYLSGLIAKFDGWIEEDLSSFPDLDVSFVVRQKGDPHEGILKFATEIGADLIVVGLVGRGHQVYRYAGSTAQAVLEGSDCSVLAVKVK